MSRPKGSKNKPKRFIAAAADLPLAQATGNGGSAASPPSQTPPPAPLPASPGEAAIGNGEREKDIAPLREYLAGEIAMRAGRFDLMAAEFSGLAEADLPKFQEVMAIHTRGWMILRRLFGIQSVIPDRDAVADDLRTWPRAELTAALGLSAAELKDELDRLRGVWESVKAEKAKEEAKRAKEVELDLRPESSKGELFFRADQLVKDCGMEDLLQRTEIPWMAGRLEACARIINHSQVGELMRHALLTELEIRRLQTRRAKTSKQLQESEDVKLREALEREYGWVFKSIAELMKIYQDQIERIDKIFPFFKISGGTANMKQVFSDAIECHAEWHRDGSNELADGVFAAAEIEVLMRMSVQAPEPQYRLDLVVYLNQARAFLWDPKWTGRFSPGAMKKLRAGFTEAAARTSQADGETLVDLLSDDPTKGEYAALPPAK
jgi:hypothetical protein